MTGFGIIGLGSISGAHVAGILQANEDARLIAVCDIDEQRARAVGSKTGARVYTDYRELLADPEVGAVDLPLPHELHFEVACHALEAGKHVIVEKPMALTVGECEEMIALSRARELSLSVSENTRFVAAYGEVQRILNANTLGKVRLIRSLIYGTEVRKFREMSERLQPSEEVHAGAIFDAGPHTFYLLKWLFGEIDSIHAHASKALDTSPVEDNAVVSGRLKSGPVFTSDFTFTAEIPWGERLEIYGSDGVLIVDQLLDPPAVLYRGQSDRAGRPVETIPYLPDRVEHDPNGWKFRSIADGIAAFAVAVNRRRPPPVDALDAQYAIRVVESAYRSVKADGRSVIV